tara:strand:+ start:704 stop:1717 length:1014 start_codon:yes stop_codon:yes gene_type:complete
MTHHTPLLEVRGLRTWFHTPAGVAKAVDGVDLTLHRGQTLALVGESGSGKSVTAASLLRLVPPPGRIEAGQVLLQGTDLLQLDAAALRRVRGGRIGMVFQDLSALNPVQTIGAQIAEAVQLHQPQLGRRAAWERALQLLAQVRLPDPKAQARAVPHRLSGGQRQRALIALALAGEPELLVADEPTTALDVTTQAEILALLAELQRSTGLGLLLITHDLGVVAQVADRAAVMYAGRIVEEGPVAELFAAPRHPYTAGLLASVALEQVTPGSRLPEIGGTVPSLLTLPPGCAFAPRCAQASPRCQQAAPLLLQHGGRASACHHPLAPARVEAVDEAWAA